MLAVAALAAERPDFTGQWRLNVTKSDFADKSVPVAARMKVVHKDPSLVVARIIDSGNGEISSQTTYSTDGKETINKLPAGGEVKNRTTWEGGSLTIESPAEVNGQKFVIRWKWTLSSDGKTLTTVRTFAGGEGAQTEIYERQ
jgi:hypothetical protein